MSKVRIYINPREIKSLIKIDKKDVLHKIRNVLRLKKGESIYVFDGQGREYLYQIKEVRKDRVLIEEREKKREEGFPERRLILGFPLLREEKISIILQKATELGVTEVCPFICQYSLTKMVSASKIERWKKIVLEATRQSERLWVPQISRVLSFKEVLHKEAEERVVFSKEGKYFREWPSKEVSSVFVVVGPEGDFSPQEVDEFKRAGFKFWRLSPHILRTETAAILGVGLIRYFQELVLN